VAFSLGTPLQPDELASAVAQVDSDGDGMINCDDFLEWWLRQRSSPREHEGPRAGGSSSMGTAAVVVEQQLLEMTPQQIAAKKIAEVRFFTYSRVR
jgi:hypothetical protein